MATKLQLCPTCKGQQILIRTIQDSVTKQFVQQVVDCPTCAGSGIISVDDTPEQKSDNQNDFGFNFNY